MITTDRQYTVTKQRAEEFRTAIREFKELDLVKAGIDPIIVSAQRASLVEQLHELEQEIEQYETLKSGEQTTLLADDVADLGRKLIEGRIAQGLSQKALAERLGMKEQQVQRYEQERYKTASLSRISEVARALGLTLQAELAIGARSTREAQSFATNFDPKKLPLKVMRDRKWFDLFDDLPRGEDLEKAMAFVLPALNGPHVHAMHRQVVRTGSKVDDYALLAWKACILHKARKIAKPLNQYPTLDAGFIHDLVSLSRDERNGPVLAVQRLRDRGIPVVFERHLQGTHLDGAAMLLDSNTPVIGMTLRHNRFDNFWFVLLHEIGHIVLHRDQGLLDGFFDDEAATPKERVEQEADDYSQNAMLSMEIWMNSFVRYSRSREDIREFARKHRISPAIVAGRIRRERKDYTIFSDLVGQGKLSPMIEQAGLLEA